MSDTSSQQAPADQAPPPPVDGTTADEAAPAQQAPADKAPPPPVDGTTADEAAPAAGPAAPSAPSLTGDDVNAIAQATARILAGSTQVQAPPPPAAAEPPPPPSPENLFTKGQVVKFEWDDHYDGPSARYGMVVDTLPDEGEGARSIVAWFHDVSAPIGDQHLAAG